MYREQYFDLNVRHFHEKLVEEHQIELSYTWVKQALQAASLVKRKSKRGVHRKRRERRPLPGMMLHIDGSDHQWFQDEPRHDLIVMLDDATSEIYYAQLAEEERTATVMAGLRAVIELKGLFCSLYSDRGAHFWLTPKSGGKVDYDRPTQVGRAMKELGVHMIPAYSPQARGRSERNFSTWQGRLPQELRLRGIRTLEGANTFLSEHYIAEFNRRFTVSAAQRGTAFISCRHRNLEMIFRQRYERTVDRDNTVRFHNLVMQLERAHWRHSVMDSAQRALQGARIEIKAHGLTATSDAQGHFNISGVPAGDCAVTVSYVGFSELSTNVRVTADAVAQVTATMKIAGGSQEVEVRADRERGEVEALNRERTADNIIQVLPSEVIMSLPNTNMADALGRLPSVSLERDEGEGKYVQVRGTEPRLTNVTINGVHVSSLENNVRNAKLDVIPASLVESIEVSKTLSASQDGDAIGGSVNLVTRTAESRPLCYWRST